MSFNQKKSKGLHGLGRFSYNFRDLSCRFFHALGSVFPFPLQFLIGPLRGYLGWLGLVNCDNTLVSGLANHNKRRKENEPIRSRRENMLPELSAGKPDVRYAKSGWFSILQNLHLSDLTS